MLRNMHFSILFLALQAFDRIAQGAKFSGITTGPLGALYDFGKFPRGMGIASPASVRC